MFEQIEEVPCIPALGRQDSLDLTMSYLRDNTKAKFTLIIPADDCSDEVSTVASSNFASQNTFETPEKSKRKQSWSDFNNFDTIYEKIENFLDQENLHITSPSPVIQRRTLKPCLALPNFDGLCQNIKQNAQDGLNILSGQDNNKTATLPAFLVKRAASSGVGSKTVIITSETKPGFSRSSIFQNRSTIVVPPKLSLV